MTPAKRLTRQELCRHWATLSISALRSLVPPGQDPLLIRFHLERLVTPCIHRRRVLWQRCNDVAFAVHQLERDLDRPGWLGVEIREQAFHGGALLVRDEFSYRDFDGERVRQGD